MKTLHTAAPWHIGLQPGPMIYGPQGEHVCDVRIETVMPDERNANARLIAAAPELLEACKLAREALTPARNDEEMTAMNALNAAITKATAQAGGE